MAAFELSPGRLKGKLPHILLIVTDQFRHDAFGTSITPNLYNLATTASSSASSTTAASTSLTTLFSNAYSSTPTCTPARAALLTGKSPWNHGMLGYAPAVDCEHYATTLPAVLAQFLGYETAVVGKNHFGTTSTTSSKTSSTTSPKSTTTTTKPSNSHRRFIDHGYEYMELYDGLNASLPDDYDKFFDAIHPGVDPLSTCHLGWNDWRACPYEFDEYLHPTAWTTRRALKEIDKTMGHHDSSDSDSDSDDSSHQHQHRPLFLKVSYHRPHSPYDPPKRLWDKHASRSKHQHQPDKDDPIYARNIGTDPSCWDGDYYVDYTSSSSNNNNTTQNSSNNSNSSDRNRNHNNHHRTRTMPSNAWHGDPGEKEARRSRAAYFANVEFVDEGVGLILEALRKHGQLETNTLVVWTSDHGDMNGDHNLWRKGYPWEASSHINMVMKLPASMVVVGNTESTSKSTSKSTARVSDAIVELRDVAPTIYDCLGILEDVKRLDPMVNGKSLLPILLHHGNNSNGASNADASVHVRTHLDLEHSSLFGDDRIHWNAIVGRLPLLNDTFDNTISSTSSTSSAAAAATTIATTSSGHPSNNCTLYKYVFFAGTGREQLFCLSEDPKELEDLVQQQLYEPVLSYWRSTMAKNFADEGRGHHWVTEDGHHLVVRTKGMTYGPNYPCSSSLLGEEKEGIGAGKEERTERVTYQ